MCAARMEDLGPGDLVKVDCAACCRGAPAEFRRTLLLTHGVADPGIPDPARCGTTAEGARPQGSVPMSAVWCSRPSRRVDQPSVVLIKWERTPRR